MPQKKKEGIRRIRFQNFSAAAIPTYLHLQYYYCASRTGALFYYTTQRHLPFTILDSGDALRSLRILIGGLRFFRYRSDNVNVWTHSSLPMVQALRHDAVATSLSVAVA